MIYNISLSLIVISEKDQVTPAGHTLESYVHNSINDTTVWAIQYLFLPPGTADCKK